MANRFPFPSYPIGWFVVGFSGDVGPGDVRTVHYFGRDIVLFRGMSGSLSAVDKTCPHLGAHLGHGRVDGECLRCPFHDWAFDTSGQCVEVPYAPKIPARAKVETWPLVEQNGVILLHHHPERLAPTWTPSALPEAGWTADRTIRWELLSHPQEVAENTVDCSHLRPVHHVIETNILEVEDQDHRMRVLLHLFATGHVIGMPDEVNDVHLDVTLNGLGIIVSQTHVLTSGMKTRQRIHPTPIDEERIAIFAVANTLAMPDPDYTREIDEIFWQAFTTDFAKDFPIWENKAYLEKPLLAGGDGPIGRYRRWARQFYVGTPKVASASVEVDVATAAPMSAGGARPSSLGPLERLAIRFGATPTVGAIAQRLRGAATAWLSGEKPGATAAHRSDHMTGDPEDSHTAMRPTPPSALGGDARAPQGKLFPSVDAYFDSLEERFDPAAAGELEAVFQWILTDDRKLDHFAQVRRGTIQKAPGVHASPTVTIEMTANDYLRMINGELNGAFAFTTGLGRLSGPVRLAMRMQRIFPLAPPPRA